MDISANTARLFRSARSGGLVWLLSLLLLGLPYSELVQACVPQPPAQLPCHQAMVPQPHHDCQYEVSESGCQCCQLQAPVSMIGDVEPVPCLEWQVVIGSLPGLPGVPAISPKPPFRPPIPTTA